MNKSNLQNTILYTLYIVLFLCFSLYSCSDDLFLIAEKKDSTSTLKILDFIAQEGNDNREILLTWNNPSSIQFLSVILLKKTGSFPSNYNDPEATILHTGKNLRYRDFNLTPDTTYYYAIYALDTAGKYSQASYAYRTITETDLDIRKRSIYIVGGATVYGAPGSNSPTTSIDMFDPLTETMYSNIASLPTARAFCDVASVNSKIYIFGGYNAAGTVVSTIDVLNIEDLSWSTANTNGRNGASNNYIARCACRTAVWNGYIYVLGGSTTNNATGSTSLCQRYDPQTDSWISSSEATSQYTIKPLRNINTTPSVRSAFTVGVCNGTIYYCGGVNDVGARITSNPGIYYNISTNLDSYFAGLLANYGTLSVMYHKDLNNGEEINIFFTIGGSYDTSNLTSFPPTPGSEINTIDSINANRVYALYLPNLGTTPAGFAVIGIAGTQQLNKAYGAAEYYGDYIYTFGGLTGNGATSNSVLASIEKFDINNGTLTKPWTTLTTTLGIARYGFGVTKIHI